MSRAAPLTEVALGGSTSVADRWEKRPAAPSSESSSCDSLSATSASLALPSLLSSTLLCLACAHRLAFRETVSVSVAGVR